MRRGLAVIVATGAGLAACGGAAQSETTAADVPDGLITCAMPDYDGVSGVTVTQSFILIDGRVKRYSDFNNQAFDLCAPGQDGCSLGIEDGAIAMTYTSPKGVGSRYRVDLASMDMEAWETKPGEAERRVSFAKGSKCVRGPLPEGLKVN
ncbi:hypothetical protein [Citromicrobium bathyomarinum]|uniref:hypothetical protein n=1 Tax=Citromicrobium bathyomarinum TaxID=72174 RepID=UPI00315A105A